MPVLPTAVADYLEQQAAEQAQYGPPAPVAPIALDGWAGLQTAVNVTLRERLGQSQTHRARAWAALSRG